MSSENVELVRRAYAAAVEAYKTGDLAPVFAEFADPDIVFSNETVTSGYPERGEWRGRDGLLQFASGQVEAFKEMWMRPDEFIDAGDRVVVPLRLGGRGRHTDIEIELSVIHVVTVRNGRAARIDVFDRMDRAFEAAGLGS